MNDAVADQRDRDADDMERFTVRLPKGMQTDIRRLVKTGRYTDKSDVIRDGLRKLIREAEREGEI
jgi:putative addiction module CopG family antidote